MPQNQQQDTSKDKSQKNQVQGVQNQPEELGKKREHDKKKQDSNQQEKQRKAQ